MNFENELNLGIGIYTPTEIAQILRVPSYKVNRWISQYWDGVLGREFESRYSWKTENSKAVSFHTLIEFYVMMELAEKGVKTRKVLEAHKELSKIRNTPFPFASREVLEGLETDGKKIYFKIDDVILTLDDTGQLNLDFIEIFFKNLEFDSENLASRFWPLGKDKAIIIDPARKFGHAVINSHNIYPETIFNHYKAGDPLPYIAHVYELTEKQVEDALEFCNAA